MSILDSFYILFGTKNVAQTRSEISSIDKQLDDMDKKGKKRGEGEDKRYQELKKQRKELIESLQQQQRALDTLGNSFENFAKNAIGAGLAYVSFGALKAGILDAQKFNRELAIQAKVSGQNVTELKAFDAAYQQTGGSAEGFLSLIKNWTAIAAQANRPLHNIGDVIGYIRDQIKGLPKETQQFILQQRYGLPTESLAFFEQTNEQYDELIKKNKQLAAVTEEDTKIADDFGEAWSNAVQLVDKRFTHLGTIVLPYVTKLLKGMVTLSEEAKSPAGLIGNAEVTTIKQVLGFFGIKGKSKSPAENPPVSGSSKQQIADFWSSKGYDSAATAAWVAQAQVESSFDPTARNGSHFGLYQWDAERRRRIKKETDTDIGSAPLHSQLEAAFWEAQTMGLTPSALNGKSANGVSNILTTKFEIPSTNPYQLAAEASKRARIASSYGNLSNAGAGEGGDSKTINVKIDDISISTMATNVSEIASGIGTALLNEIKTAYWNANDGSNN